MTLGDEDYITVDCVLRSEVLRYRTRSLIQIEAEKLVSELLDQTWDQMRRDALVGTYSDYSRALFPIESEATFARIEQAGQDAARIKPEFAMSDLATGILAFRLELQAKWFDHPRIGLQHLVHVLCGDIFGRAIGAIGGSVEVRSVALGRLRDRLIGHFRAQSHDIDAIRRLFRLDAAPLLYAPGKTADLPLLGFSLKPRNGLDAANFKAIALGVLRAGFNLVEADVRNVDFMSDAWRAVFAEIAAEAVNIPTHVARFSLTLSGPADLVLRYAEEFRALHPADTPWAVKVDGGLDGLSTVQALREGFVGHQPVITSYPILGDVLAGRIGSGTYRDMLILSGVDIIYPGGAPRFGLGDFVDREAAERAIRRYREIVRQGWPMPSIAGGVFAGQLPAYYEIFGPKVAYFLGGGVALHRNGAFFPSPRRLWPPKRPSIGTPISPNQQVAGAELCRYAVEAAASTSDLLEIERLLAYSQEHYQAYVEGKDPGSKYQFIRPSGILGGSVRSFRGG